MQNLPEISVRPHARFLKRTTTHLPYSDQSFSLSTWPPKFQQYSAQRPEIKISPKSINWSGTISRSRPRSLVLKLLGVLDVHLEGFLYWLRDDLTYGNIVSFHLAFEMVVMKTDTETYLNIAERTFSCLLIGWSFLTIHINILLKWHDASNASVRNWWLEYRGLVECILTVSAT